MYISSIAVLPGVWELSDVSEKVDMLTPTCNESNYPKMVLCLATYQGENSLITSMKLQKGLLISTVTRGKYDVERNGGMHCRSIDDSVAESMFT